MATVKLRDYLLALSSKGTAAGDSDKLTILDSADSNAIKTILKSDLVDLDSIVSELQDDFLDQFGEGTFSGSAQVDHDTTTNFVANEHIDHTSVSIIAGDGLTGGGDISSDRTINIVSDNNGIVVNADQIELDTDSSTFSGGVLTKMNIEQVVSGSSQISADQTDGWVGDVKTQLNSNTVISGSTFSSPSQGTLRATINGVDSDVDLGLQSGDNVTFTDGNFTGNVVITGNLDVLGDSVEIQTSDLRIEDKLITVASGSTTSVAADGAGLEIDGADKSMKWNHSTQQFVFDAKVSSSVGFKGEGGELTGIDTDQVTEAGNLYYTDGRVKTKLNTEGVVSGSAQIDITQTTNYSSINQYTDSDNTSHLNSLGVISGSSQIDLSQATGTAANATNATNATNADNIALTADSTNTNRYVPFTATTTGDGTLLTDAGLLYNPSSNILTATTFNGSLSGNATTATNATNADNIALTSDSTNTNRYVTFTSTATGDGTLLTDAGLLYNPSSNTLTATTFNGDLSGNATTATTATSANSVEYSNVANKPTLVSGSLQVVSSLLNQTVDLGTGGLTATSITASRLQLQDGSSNLLIGGTLPISLDPSSGTNNIFVGNGAGDALTTGDANVGIGVMALSVISDELSDGNVAIGYGAAQYMDSGSYNVSLGYGAMNNSDNCIGQVGIGVSALFASDNDYNVGIGYEAGRNVGAQFVGVGYRVGYGLGNTTNTNTGVGYLALGGQGTVSAGNGDYNTAFGGYSLRYLKDGFNNTAIGRSSALSLTDGDDNTLVGTLTGQYLSTGNNNTIIGGYAANTLVSGSGNTTVGYLADVQNSDDYNSIVIGSGSIGNGSNTVVIGNDDITSTELKGNVTGSALSIIDTSNPGSDYGSVVIEGRRDGSPNVLTLRAKDNGTPASALPQDQGAVVRWQGFDGTDFANMGYILVAADGQAVAASDAPSYMAFGVSPDASETPSEVMRLDSDGVLSLNDTSNDVFINNNGTSMELDVNRHPETGVFSDTSKGHARISMVGDTGGSKILFNTANAINTTATTVAEISSGSFSVLDNKIEVGNTSVSANGVTIEKTGNHLFLRATTAPAGEYWNFDVDANNRLNVINDNSVGVYIDDAATSWTGTSDERLKNINYELTGSLSNLQSLRAVNYSWVSGSVDKNFYGLIAQDVEEHYPDMISEDKDGYKGIRYTEMIPVLVSAIKEQQSIIDDLKSRIETLENS
jgi:hypothetical protein